MAEEEYRVYFEFLGQLGELLERLTEISREKTAAVRRDDLATVDECMKKEQAISMQLRAMDGKRDKLLEGLGLTGTTLAELPARCPESLRSEAKAVSRQVRDRYQVYRAAADVARTTLECNLHQIEKLLSAGQDGELRPPESFADIRA